MKNETVTLSRECECGGSAEIRYESPQCYWAECEDCGGRYAYAGTAEACAEIWNTRAALADPVQPAGGDSSQTKIKPVFMLRVERLWGKDGEYAVTTEDHEWVNGCRKVGGDFPVYSGEVVTRLQAEVARKTHAYQVKRAELTEERAKNDDLQSDLTKARELSGLSAEAFSVLQGMVEHCLNVRACMGMDEGFKDFDTEEEHDFVKELRTFLAHQSAPAAKGRGEPVAYRYKEGHASYENEKAWEPTTLAYGAMLLERKALVEDGAFKGDEQAQYLALKVEPLYAEQPAPVAFPGYLPVPEDRKLPEPVAAASPDGERLMEIVERYPNGDPLEYDAALRQIKQ